MFNSDEELFAIIKNYAKSNSMQDDIHGFPHVQRVYNLCMKIAKKTRTNFKILKTAALLHDIGRVREINGQFNKNHSEISAKLAQSFLNSLDYAFSQEEIDQITHCIRSHSYSNQVKPNTLEAQILSDADKLDALGAIGLYRTIAYTIKKNGDVKQVIHHLENKILKLPSYLYLEISKEIANKRLLIIQEFFKEISNQV